MASSHSTNATDDYRVHTPVFDGPLDLLLHLIRKEQIDIYDIPIARICQSYLEHAEQMQRPDVNVAGEFMVMASTLIYIKSLMLLPRDGTEEDDDPRAPLVRQLLEYERFRKAAEQIDTMDWLQRDIYPRPYVPQFEAIPVEALADAPLEPVDPLQLLICLKAAMSRTTRPPIRIEMDPVSIREKVTQMGELLEAESVVEFTRLLPEAPRARDVIIAFFAILEMARMKYVEILQHELFGPIHIRGVRPIRELNVAMLEQF